MNVNKFFTNILVYTCVSFLGIDVPSVFAIGEMNAIKTIISEQAPGKDKFEIELPVVAYTAESYKDPFQGVVIEEPETETGNKSIEPINLPNLKIQGIIWGTNTPQAIINNKVVKAGSTINDVTIIEITSTEIIISYKNQKIALPAPSGIKTPEIKLKGGKNGT